MNVKKSGMMQAYLRLQKLNRQRHLYSIRTAFIATMPIDMLKIDGSLSREVVRQPANLEIIATIYDLCRLMKVETVVEYVDNRQQPDKLKSVGAFLIQGYLFSAPLPAEKISEFIAGLGPQCRDAKEK